MLFFLIKLKNLILDILFPPICLHCQKHLENKNKLICEECLSLIKINNALFCPICKARLADYKQICRHKTFSYFLAAAGNYDDPVLRNLIHYFKYQSFKNLTPILSEILIKYLNSLNFKFYILNYSVVPIPLHPQRERKRGFNQSKLLAEKIADYFNLPLIDELEKTINNNPHAKIKGVEKRIKNISGCFKIKNSENVKKKNIILIDDIFTSGATINEAIKILKENNVGKIIALVIAKA